MRLDFTLQNYVNNIKDDNASLILAQKSKSCAPNTFFLKVFDLATF